MENLSFHIFIFVVCLLSWISFLLILFAFMLPKHCEDCLYLWVCKLLNSRFKLFITEKKKIKVSKSFVIDLKTRIFHSFRTFLITKIQQSVINDVFAENLLAQQAIDISLLSPASPREAGESSGSFCNDDTLHQVPSLQLIFEGNWFTYPFNSEFSWFWK